MSKGGRQPDYHLHVIVPDAGGKEIKGRVGAGWKEEDGRISIRIDPCVVLAGNDGLVVALFTNNYKDKPKPERQPRHSSNDDMPDDDIPF